MHPSDPPSTGPRQPRLVEVLIDDATWEAAAAERRAEWRVVFAELVSEHRFDVEIDAPHDDRVRMFVTSGADGLTLDLRGVDGRDVAHVELPLGELQAILKEYMETCREMGKLHLGENSPRLEALDIAKRIVHDEGGEAVQRMARALRPDHATSRRLFTLIVTLRFDTTRLALPHPPPLRR